MRLALADEGAPFHIERFAAFQDFHDIDLPPAVLAHLRERNAARPVARIVPDGGNERIIDRFLGMVERDHPLYAYHVDVVVTQLDERILFDPDGPDLPLLPLAALDGGDFMCLDLREDGAPVVIWDHEASDDMAPAVHRIADDWDAFLAMLKEG